MHYLTIMLTLFVFGVQSYPYIEIKTEHTFKESMRKDIYFLKYGVWSRLWDVWACMLVPGLAFGVSRFVSRRLHL